MMAPFKQEHCTAAYIWHTPVSQAGSSSQRMRSKRRLSSRASRRHQKQFQQVLIEITYPGVNNFTQLSYDGLGKNTKIVETVGGSVTNTKQFVWCDGNRCEERDGTGAWSKKFFSAGQRNLSTNYFYSVDHLGSIREMTDSSGVIQAQYVFDPYGRSTKSQGSQTTDFQYAGYYAHEPSNFNLTFTRAYSCTLGRFINRDRMEFMDGGNPFGYANGNPVSLRDPSGLRPLTGDEKAFINKWFPGCFSPRDLKGINIFWTPFRNYSPGNGFILLNQPFNASAAAGGAFAHEVYHILQTNENPNFPLLAAYEQLAMSGSHLPPGGDPYTWSLPSVPYDAYAYHPSQPILPQFMSGNVEMQGQIVEDMIHVGILDGGIIPSIYSDTYNEVLRRCKCKKKRN